MPSMPNIPNQTKPISRPGRIIWIAAIIALILVVTVAIGWFSYFSFGRFGHADPLSAHGQIASAQAKNIATVRSVASPTKSNRDPVWEKLLEKVAIIMREKKAEVCGLSDLDAAFFLAEQEVMFENPQDYTDKSAGAVNAALIEASGKYRNSDSPREQAVGLYVRAYIASIIPEPKSANCTDAAACLIVTDESQQVRLAVLEPLVKLALAGNDPGIYALATYACTGLRTGVCASVNFGNWARMEPDNAAVWLMVASDALMRKDNAARDDALRRAAAARGYDAHTPQLAPLLNDGAVKALPPMVRARLDSVILSMQNRDLTSPYMGLISYCMRGETTDPARNAVCTALADKLLEKDSSIIGSRMATKIATKMGWDASRLKALRDETVVEYATLFDVAQSAYDYSCENLAKTNLYAQQVLSKGDRAALREHATKSGKTMIELVEGYRKTSPDLFK